MEKTTLEFDTNTHREASDAEKYTMRQKLFKSEAVYPMWVADMEFKASQAIQNALAKRVAHGVYGYAMPDDELFSIASEWVERRHKVRVEASMFGASPSIVTTMSASVEAFSSAGDGVTVLTPIYPPFLDVVHDQNRTLHTVVLKEDDDRYSIDYTMLEEAFAHSTLFLLCNPHNPVGRVWEKEELQRMAALAIKYDVTIVSDDAHADVVRADKAYVHISSAEPAIAQQCVTLLGPGKGFNISGLGTTLFYSNNKEMLTALKKVMHARHVVPGHFLGFHALKAAYKESETWLDNVNHYIDTNIEYACARLNKECAPLKAHYPEGTYLLWIDCRGLGLKDLAIKRFFTDECHLGLSQGQSFGEGGRGFMRMNCAVPFEKLQWAIDQIKAALERKA